MNPNTLMKDMNPTITPTPAMSKIFGKTGLFSLGIVPGLYREKTLNLKKCCSVDLWDTGVQSFCHQP